MPAKIRCGPLGGPLTGSLWTWVHKWSIASVHMASPLTWVHVLYATKDKGPVEMLSVVEYQQSGIMVIINNNIINVLLGNRKNMSSLQVDIE